MISDHDLVTLMVFVAGRMDPKGAFQRDVGGRTVSLMATEPFEKRMPHAKLWVPGEWEIDFDLPKGFPQHIVLKSPARGEIPKTYLFNVEFKGDLEALTREAIYAKMMS